LVKSWTNKMSRALYKCPCWCCKCGQVFSFLLWMVGTLVAFVLSGECSEYLEVFTTLFMLFDIWGGRLNWVCSEQKVCLYFLDNRFSHLGQNWGHYSTDKIPLFVALSSQTWSKFLFDGHLLHFALVLGWSRHCESCIKLPHEVDSQECRCEWECAVEKVGNCTSTIFYWCLCVMRLLR
jgi:hypothetical protein